jgi:hypothetical protein
MVCKQEGEKMKFHVDNATFVVVIVTAGFLITAGVFACMAAGVDFSHIIRTVPQQTNTPSQSEFQIAVDDQPFPNGTAIEWNNLQVGINSKSLSLLSNKDATITLLFPDLPNGLTVSCPLNNTGIMANILVNDNVTLFMSQEAGSEGASMNTQMLVCVQDGPQ